VVDLVTKVIFITGGVMSGLGKGTVAASIAKILQFRGFAVSIVKCDPYLNVDAGTMNPVEHGENFVCEEIWEFNPARDFKFRIAEVDQDFGTYERFTGQCVHPSHNITSGQIYLSVILKERTGEFLGKTVQIIPHVTDEIKSRLKDILKEGKDFIIVEIGGTVGDIEGMPFLEAVRQLRIELGKENSVLIHVTYVPYLSTIQQLKTKPTQHSLRKLLESGLIPDIIIARSEVELNEDARQKIALFSGLSKESIISAPNLSIIYEIPLAFERQNLGDLLLKKLMLKPKRDPMPGISEWKKLVNMFRSANVEIKIALVGKYTKIVDSYISIIEALKHAGAHNSLKVTPVFVDAERVDEKKLMTFDGILLTPGFGVRAAEGMIQSAKIALEKNIPFLGICFGAQLATVAFARYIMKWEGANSTEIDPNTPYPVVDLLPGQRNVELMGGTMRLGAIKVRIIKNTILYKAYEKELIKERFRHRYHIIKKFADKMTTRGYKVNAYDTDGNIVGFEVEGHPYFVGVQWHPEFKSRPFSPSPVYLSFIGAIKRYRLNFRV